MNNRGTVSSANYFNPARWPAAVLAVVCVCFYAFAEPVAAEPTEPAIDLDQTHFFMGHMHVVVGQSGIRIEDTAGLSFTVVAAAPDWRVTVFQTKDKTFYSLPFDLFLKSALVPDLLVSKRSDTVNNSHRPITCKIQGFDAAKAIGQKRYLEYMPLKNLSPQIADIFYTVYKLPTGGGIPLNYFEKNDGRDYLTGAAQDGKDVNRLSTKRITSVVVNKSLFRAPTGYHKAKSLQQAVSGNQNREDSKDFQDLFEMKTK